MNALIVFTIGGGLLVDYHWVAHGQAAASAASWILCLALWLQSDARRRPALAACLAIATTGEVILSLGWGLYTYRLENIPLFVPPGHVLLFYLGTQLARRMPQGSEWWVAALALPVVMAFAWTGQDTLGPVLYAMFLACLWISPSRSLYATMFVLSMALELWGTWIGNWVWSERVPGLGLTTLNPPIAAGTFYCVLDLLVVAAAVGLERAYGRAPLSVSAATDPASPGLKASTDSTQDATLSACSSAR
jgi:hypothetical protein